MMEVDGGHLQPSTSASIPTPRSPQRQRQTDKRDEGQLSHNERGGMQAEDDDDDSLPMLEA